MSDVHDMVGDLVVFFRYDEKLARLSVASHNEVDGVAHDTEHDVTVYYGRNVVVGEVRATYYYDIEQHQQLAEAHVVEFVDYHGKYVGAAGASSVHETYCDTQSVEGAAQYGGEQFVVMKPYQIGRYYVGQNRESHRHEDHGIHRLDAECRAYDYQSGYQ